MTVAGVSPPRQLQPLTERIVALLVDADDDPRSGLPAGFTHRELAASAYGTKEPTPSNLSAVRRSVARLVDAGRAERGGRRYPGQVLIRRPLSPAQRMAQVEARRRSMDRWEARRRTTPYPVDTGHAGVVEVPVEPVLKITEDGVELRESREVGS